MRGLWEHESTGLIGSLIELLEADEDPAVRAEAALALGRYVVMFELGRLRENHFERVESALRRTIEKADEIEEVRARAIEAIGPREVPWVRQAIREAYESDQHRLKVSAVHAMGRSGSNRWLPLLIRELASDEAELRYEAALAAGAIGDESVVSQILPLLVDEDDDVREAASAALGEIGGSGGEEGAARDAGQRIDGSQGSGGGGAGRDRVRGRSTWLQVPLTVPRRANAGAAARPSNARCQPAGSSTDTPRTASRL